MKAIENLIVYMWLWVAYGIGYLTTLGPVVVIRAMLGKELITESVALWTAIVCIFSSLIYQKMKQHGRV